MIDSGKYIEDNMSKPEIFTGGLVKNEDGSIQFNNDFKIKLLDIQRYYTISLFNKNFRGWHGHKQEHKYCLCLDGSVKIGAVEIDNWDNPSKNLIPLWYDLKEDDCKILHIPGGYANGVMNLNDTDSRIMFFSNFTLSESENDDYRFLPKYWR